MASVTALQSDYVWIVVSQATSIALTRPTLTTSTEPRPQENRSLRAVMSRELADGNPHRERQRHICQRISKADYTRYRCNLRSEPYWRCRSRKQATLPMMRRFPG